MMSQAIVSVVGVILGGSLLGAVAALIQARAQIRKVRLEEERSPAEVESIWLTGAERAFSALQGALDRTAAEISRLETALERERQQSAAKDERIADLERRLGTMRQQLSHLQSQADRLGVDINELRADEDRTEGA